MTMFGNALLVGGSALLAVGTFSNLNPAQIPAGFTTGIGLAAIGAGAAIEMLP